MCDGAILGVPSNNRFYFTNNSHWRNLIGTIEYYKPLVGEWNRVRPKTFSIIWRAFFHCFHQFEIDWERLWNNIGLFFKTKISFLILEIMEIMGKYERSFAHLLFDKTNKSFVYLSFFYRAARSLSGRNFCRRPNAYCAENESIKIHKIESIQRHGHELKLAWKSQQKGRRSRK